MKSSSLFLSMYLCTVARDGCTKPEVGREGGGVKPSNSEV